MKITSWNVNWIRAIATKWFTDWVKIDNADIYCFQETKAFEHQIPQEIKDIFVDYDYCRHAGTRAGYAGTAIFWRKSIITDVVSCNIFHDNPMFYEDGRVTEINFTLAWLSQPLTLCNIYFPNGGTRADGTEMLSYKLAFYDCLIEYIQYKRSSGRGVVVVWDYNICHTEIDIARPKENENSIWFLPVERQKISEYLVKADMVDVFRHFYPHQTDEYTWRSYRAWARPRNIGRRIDYATVSSDILWLVKDFQHQQTVLWSDHCPVSIVIG